MNLRSWCLRFGGLFGKERKDRELAEELESHLQMHIEDNVRAGMDADEARRHALLQLGGLEQTKERYRERRGWLWLESLFQDVRFGARMLRRSPVFTISAVLILALGIGATTVVFSVFDAVLLRPLPVRHPEKLVRMVQELPRIGVQSSFPLTYYEALRDHSTTLESAFGETVSYVRFAMTDPAPTEQVTIRGVTPEFFDVLGVNALYGRVLTPRDANGLAEPPIVLSYGFWRRRFGGDPQAIGRTLALRGHRFLIVGVTPPEFNGFTADTAPDVRVPWQAIPLAVPNLIDEQLFFEVAGRLKPGVTRVQAEAESLAIWKTTMEKYYRDIEKYPPEGVATLLSRGMRLDALERGVSIVRDRFGSVLQLLMVSVSVLLLIACANLAGLQLARGTTRRQEMAVRRATGATQFRLVRQTITENLLLMTLGGAGGAWVAALVTPAVVGFLPQMRNLDSALLPLSLNVEMNGRVFVFSLVVSAVAFLLFGLAPAIAATRVSLSATLRAGRSASPPGTRALIVFQVALCTILITCAGLLVRTFQVLRAVNPGFDSEHVATFTADAWAAGYTSEKETAFLRRLTEKVRQIPGVASVAISSRGVMRGRGMASTTAPTGQRTTRADFLNTDLHMVSPEYFDTMGIRVLSGRIFNDVDDYAAKPQKVLVNQAFVRRFFPNDNPLGKQFGLGLEAVVGANYQIIGVVSDAKYRSLRQPILPTYYMPGSGYGVFVLNVRTQAPTQLVLQPVQKALTSIDPGMTFLEIHTLADEVDESTANERMAAALASFLAAFALALSVVGLYGLLAYVAGQRRCEIGVRMAMGAQHSAVLQMVVLEGMNLVLAGVVIGIAGALGLARFLSSLLYGVTPTDPATFVAVAFFLLAVALLACYIPARRAAHVDPMTALRHE